MAGAQVRVLPAHLTTKKEKMMKHVYAIIYDNGEFDLYSSYKKAKAVLEDYAIMYETTYLNGDTLEVTNSETGEYYAYISKRTIF